MAGCIEAGACSLGARLPPLLEGDRIDRWPDASGNQRHVLQPDPAAQPTYHTADQLNSLRFDGRGAYLSLLEKAAPTDSATIFLVAAPLSNAGMFVGPFSRGHARRIIRLFK